MGGRDRERERGAAWRLGDVQVCVGATLTHPDPMGLLARVPRSVKAAGPGLAFAHRC